MYDNVKQAKDERATTLNERLNKVCESMQFQCERIERVMNRVEGSPSKIESAKGGQAPVPTLPMNTIVEHLEQVHSRLADLATSIERVA